MDEFLTKQTRKWLGVEGKGFDKWREEQSID
jgi:hypothetical protein